MNTISRHSPTNKTTTNFALQWNILGLNSRLPEIQLLVSKHSPIVIAIQETLVPHSTTQCNIIKGYQFLSHKNPSNPYSRGVGLGIKNGVPYSPIPIHSTLDAICVRLEAPIKISVLSIYASPSLSFEDYAKGFEDLIPQIPTPIFLLGDFNAHSTEWGGPSTSAWSPGAWVLNSIGDRWRIMEVAIISPSLSTSITLPPLLPPDHGGSIKKPIGLIINITLTTSFP
ncbi:uncharacterized protein LOC129741250 [Uranotaenia lowii]|uniref:uncharacterized protein LOC129741250 n=1 Tax=Uranotaenia lowii TaxID=190385 RepID=UPI00247AA649|nr:uncharacterized protein LOC129741250 [Uranotaenia lowii]